MAEATTEAALSAMDAVGVDCALVNSDLGACIATVERAPTRMAGVPRLELDVADRADTIVEQIAAHPGLVALRLTPAFPFDGSMMHPWRAGAFEPFLAAAERLGVPVCMFLSGHLKDIHGTVRDHPDLRIIIDHLGFPPPPHVPLSPKFFDALPDLLGLAAYETVGVKVTGVPSLSHEAYPFLDVWPHVHRVLEAFGVERAMWGSDFTRVRTLHCYSEAVDFVRLTDQVSESEKVMICSTAAQCWFRWSAPCTNEPPDGRAS